MTDSSLNLVKDVKLQTQEPPQTSNQINSEKSTHRYISFRVLKTKVKKNTVNHSEKWTSLVKEQ